MDDFITPTVEYCDDKKDPENYVRVGVDIKGLKKTTFGNKADNADVTFECTERSFCLTVVPKGSARMSKYRFAVKQLPGEILTDDKKTFFKIKKDEVEIFLHKASPGSWARQLSSVGLDETAK
jgi:hypothetical protein